MGQAAGATVQAMLFVQVFVLLLAHTAAGHNLPPFCTSTTPVPINEVCSTLGLTDDPAACPAVKLIEQLAAGLQPPRCRLDSEACGGIVLPPAFDADGTVLPQDLPDIRSYHVGLPQSLPYKTFMKHEGSTYFWYYRSIQNLLNWAPCPSASATSDGYYDPQYLDLPVPEGWQPEAVFDLPPNPLLGGGANDALPYAVLLKPEASTSYQRRESCMRWYAEAATQSKQTAKSASSSVKAGTNSAEYKPYKDIHGDNEPESDMERDEGRPYPEQPEPDSPPEYDGSRGRRYGPDWRGSDEPDGDYGYAHDRYEDYGYTCGKDDSEGTSPHAILLIRGAITLPEWALGLAYNQVPGASLGEVYGPGNFASGYLYAATALWEGGLGDAIEQQMDEGCRSITIAGASLGGAVAQLLAVRIEGMLSEAAKNSRGASFKGTQPSPVTVVTFGSPNPGDATWAAYFNTKINARNIAFEGDLVTKIPCEPSMVGCPLSSGVSVPTPGGPWLYKRTGGNIVFPGSAMPFNSKYDVAQSWGVLNKITGQQLCDGTSFVGFVSKTHICSYMCMTSPYVNEEANLCWLDDSLPAPYGASLCTGCSG